MHVHMHVLVTPLFLTFRARLHNFDHAVRRALVLVLQRHDGRQQRRAVGAAQRALLLQHGLLLQCPGRGEQDEKKKLVGPRH